MDRLDPGEQIEGMGGEPEQVATQSQPDPPSLREYTEPGGAIGDEGVLETAKDQRLRMREAC